MAKITDTAVVIDFPPEFQDESYFEKKLDEDLASVKKLTVAEFDEAKRKGKTRQRLLEMEKYFLKCQFLADNNIFIMKFNKANIIEQGTFSKSTLFYNDILKKVADYLENKYNDPFGKIAELQEALYTLEVLNDGYSLKITKLLDNGEKYDKLKEDYDALLNAYTDLKARVGDTSSNNGEHITGTKQDYRKTKFYSLPMGNNIDRK